MLKKIVHMLLQFIFYLAASFTTAVFGYFFLEKIQSKHAVFASWFRMFPYHHNHPVSYIIIPCIFYSGMAVIFSKRLGNNNFPKRIFYLFVLIFLTLLFSFPVGGMLYFYHDMEAGYFPENWVQRMIAEGVSAGFGIGWLIIAFSFPYNVLGTVVCYFITKAGSRIFHKRQPEPDL